MKKLLLIIALVLSIKASYSQPCGPRYTSAIFSTVSQTTIPFDVQTSYLNIADTLFADIYTPVGDTLTNRAAIVFVHGGGFTGGTRNGSNIPYLCQQLAKKGYVVVSIDYRLGVSDASASQKGKAQIRAIQDLKSFIRFTKQNATTVNLDTNKIFVTGSSAGGVTALAATYLDYSEKPSYMDTTGVGGFNGKGNINGKSANVRGVFSMWGAVGDTTWIQPGNAPVGCIQALYDTCIVWTYKASSCNVPGFPSYGSFSINQRVNNLGIYSTLFGFNSNQHDYGLNNIPPLDTTIIQMSTFCYNVLCGLTSGIKDNYIDNPVNIYPNPFTSQINIQTSIPDFQYTLTNYMGQIIKHDIGSKVINTGDLPKGFYFLKIFNAKSSKTIKLIKDDN